MSISAVEGIVENGQIRLAGDVELPEHARVFVVIPDAKVSIPAHALSPHLEQPEQAADFVKEVIELPDDALRLLGL